MAAGDISDNMVVNVRRRLGEWSTAGLLDAEIFDALNRGQTDLANRLADGALDDLTLLASGNLTASREALPSDCLRIRALKVGDAYAKRWNVTELDTISEASDSDVYYYVWYHTDGVKICVELGDDASAAAYSLYYIKEPTTITTDADPDFGVTNQRLVEDFAVAECLRLRQRYGEAEQLESDYRTRIAIINSRYTDGKPYEGEAGDPKLA